MIISAVIIGGSGFLERSCGTSVTIAECFSGHCYGWELFNLGTLQRLTCNPQQISL